MTVYARAGLGLTVSTRPRPRGASPAQRPSLRWARSKRHATRRPCLAGRASARDTWPAPRDDGGQPCVWASPSAPAAGA